MRLRGDWAVASHKAGLGVRFLAQRLTRLAIVKLGGSHATGPHLKDWLAAIAAEAGSIAIVPGGGPFADAVRAAQASIGYDDRAAHAMALMAMAQFGRALAEPQSRFDARRVAFGDLARA